MTKELEQLIEKYIEATARTLTHDALIRERSATLRQVETLNPDDTIETQSRGIVISMLRREMRRIGESWGGVLESRDLALSDLLQHLDGLAKKS